LAYSYTYQPSNNHQGESLKNHFFRRERAEISEKRVQKSEPYFNHLGNVLAVITDRRIQSCNVAGVMHYDAQVVSVSDYYPFGMGIKEREWSDSTFSYRFGFNGMEKDNETYGEVNAYDFGARIYDPRLGRFLSTDPLEYQYAWQTTYAYFSNSPIVQIDFMGNGDDKPNANNPGGDNESGESTHTVVKGDVVWNIAKNKLGDAATNSDVQELSDAIVKSNSLNEKGDIYPNQVLIIPSLNNLNSSTSSTANTSPQEDFKYQSKYYMTVNTVDLNGSGYTKIGVSSSQKSYNFFTGYGGADQSASGLWNTSAESGEWGWGGWGGSIPIPLPKKPGDFISGNLITVVAGSFTFNEDFVTKLKPTDMANLFNAVAEWKITSVTVAFAGYKVYGYDKDGNKVGESKILYGIGMAAGIGTTSSDGGTFNNVRSSTSDSIKNARENAEQGKGNVPQFQSWLENKR
jgi:RHS repeat-associated protein